MINIVKRDEQAFTLIELIVVMAIIAVLVLLAAPRFLGYTKDANVTAMEQDVKVLTDAVEMYHVENEEWPIIEDSQGFSHGVGGVDYAYFLDVDKIEGFVKKSKGEFDEYGIVVKGQEAGKIFHVEGVSDRNGIINYGNDTKRQFGESESIVIENRPNVELIRNNHGQEGKNANFSRFKYSVDGYNNSGAFIFDGGNSSVVLDELIPVDTELNYRMSYAIRANPDVGHRAYGMVVPYDRDERLIREFHTMYIEGTTTKLAQPLKKGDEYIHLEDASNWKSHAGGAGHQRRFITWDYVDSTGYEYPEHTYSRNVSKAELWDAGAIDYEANTIKLNTKWADETIPAGTKISNGSNGNTYKYISGINYRITDDWTPYSGTITGIDYSGKNVRDQFPPGTKFVKVGWLLNRGGTGPGSSMISDVSFTVADE